MRMIALAAVLFLLAVSASWGSAGSGSASPIVKGVAYGSVSAVSCAAPGNCAAGGSYPLGTRQEAFVVTQTGGRWGEAIAVPGTGRLNRGGEAEVTSISCAAPGYCAAGGSYYDGNSNEQAFVVSAKNGRWGKAIEVPGTASLNTNGDASVESISCVAAGECTAGGSYRDGDFQSEAFVVSERKGRWGKAIAVPGVATLNGGGYATVTSISCAAVGKCAAGGYYTDGAVAVEQAFVVSERNGRWGTAIKVPGTATLNVGGYAYVSSVSCATAGNCAAAGVYTDGFRRTQAFIVDKTRGRWGKAVEVPGTAKLNRGGVAGFSGVSCATAGNCAGGGWYVGGDGRYQAFVVDETNGTWGSAIKAPATNNARVDSISCASAGNCAAGGVYSDGSHSGVFVVDEKKGRWGKAVVVPGTAAHPDEADVNSISCAAAGECAAGGFVTGTLGQHPFVASETNGSWGHAVHRPLPNSCVVPNVIGQAVSAAKKTLHEAYCALGKVTLAYSEQPEGRVEAQHPKPGTLWRVGTTIALTVSKGEKPPTHLSHVKTDWRATVATLPANAATGENQAVSIDSISCSSPGNCTAVGSYYDNAGKEGLLLTETAGHWATGVEAVLPADALSDPHVSLSSVSCASAGNCTAVGTYTIATADIYSEGATSGLLLTETAGEWAPGVEAALPADAGSPVYVVLHSVSCASAGNCTAVGSYSHNDFGYRSQGLLLTEKAGDWEPGVAVGLSQGDVMSVSCSSDGSCSAVGYDNYYDGGRDGSPTGDALLLTNEGGSWAREDVVSPYYWLFLTSVSCTTAGNCSVIGVTYPPLYGIDVEAFSQGAVLTEKAGVWGPAVALKPPANVHPDYSSSVGMVGISCGSLGECGTMGNYYGRDGRTHLALLTGEASTWRRGVEAVLPHGGQNPAAAAISCASPGSCTVVGSYGGGVYGLLLTEIAGRWAPGVRPPHLPNSSDSVSSVSCASRGNCGAVGIGWKYDAGPTYGVLLDSTTDPCVVPSLKGKTLPRARQSIYSHNCSVGTIAHVRSRAIGARHLISQTPRPGRHLAPGTKVDLKVSRGP